MTTNHTAAAKLIRAEIKKRGIKASVRSKSYAGGESITVRIETDMTPAAREAIEAFCSQFQAGHFDGMTDSYDYSNRRSDLPQVRHVFVEVLSQF